MRTAWCGSWNSEWFSVHYSSPSHMVCFRTEKNGTFNWIVSVIILTDFTGVVLSILCSNLLFLNQHLTHIFQPLFRNYLPWRSWPVVSLISKLLFLQTAGQHQFPSVSKEISLPPPVYLIRIFPLYLSLTCSSILLVVIYLLVLPLPGRGSTTDTIKAS